MVVHVLAPQLEGHCVVAPYEGVVLHLPRELERGVLQRWVVAHFQRLLG